MGKVVRINGVAYVADTFPKGYIDELLKPKKKVKKDDLQVQEDK